MTYLYMVDVSWPQGAYRPGSESAVFVGAVSLDGGSPFVQSTYHVQVDAARAAGKEVGHYAFNGRTSGVSVEQFADFFVNNLHDYRSGDALVLDVESSEGGKYPAWNPSEAARFIARVQSRVNTVMGVYGNRTDMGVAGWGAVKAAGNWLWIAWPGDESYLSSIGEWGSDWSMWQYDSSTGLDKNRAKKTLAALAGGVTASKRRNDMTTLYHQSNTSSYALAGDSPGTPANWIESTNADVVTRWAAAHGDAVYVSDASWSAIKALYQAPVRSTATATVTLDASAVTAALSSAFGDLTINGTIKRG